MSVFQVETPAWITVPITDHVSRRFHASPERAYDATLGLAREGGPMAKFTIEFMGIKGAPGYRDDEIVQARYYQDYAPFVDFYGFKRSRGCWPNPRSAECAGCLPDGSEPLVTMPLAKLPYAQT